MTVAIASTPWVVPAYLRHALPQWIRQTLGRQAHVGAITFNPLRLQLHVDDLQIEQAGGQGAVLQLARIDAQAAWSSLWTGVPQLATLGITRPTLRLARSTSGRLDVDDILTRLTRAPAHSGTKPPRFILRDVHVDDGTIVLVDHATGVTTTLTGLAVRLPALATSDGNGGVIHALASAHLDGAPLKIQADGPVQSRRPALRVAIDVRNLPLDSMAHYAPSTLALHLTTATATAHIVVTFAPSAPEDLDVAGDLILRDAKLAGHHDTPLGGWSTLAVRIAHVRPYKRTVEIASVQVDGLHAQLRRIEQGIAGLPVTSARPPSHPARGLASMQVSSQPRDASGGPTWNVRIDSVALRASALDWQDATLPGAPVWHVTAPRLLAGPIRWPATAAVPFDARIDGPGGVAVSARGTAGTAGVQAQVSVSHFDPRVVRPYLDASGLPTPAGMLELDATVQLAAGAPTLDVSHAQWNDFAVGGGGAPPLRASRVAIDDTRVDLASKTATIGNLTITQPMASLSRDPSGSWSWEQLLPPRGKADIANAPAHPQGAWHIGVAQARIVGGQVYFADTRPVKPVVLAVTGLDATVRGAQWPQTVPARLTIDAAVSDQLQPTAASGGVAPPGQGHVHFDGSIHAQPLQIQGTIDAQDLPAQLAEHYVPPRINAQVLRARARAGGARGF